MSEGSPLTRSSALAAPALLLLVLVVGTFVGVARYTDVFDPNTGAVPTDAFHHDPKPCLRYPREPSRSVIVAAASALLKGELAADDVGDLVGDLYARAKGREAGLHTHSEVDEYLEVFAEGSGPLRRLVISLKRDRLRDLLGKMVTATPPIKRTIASLPTKQREALEAQWVSNPSVFVLPGLLQLVREMRFQATNMRLDAVQAKLEAQIAQGLEPSLGALQGEDPNQTTDGWDNPLTLERTSDEVFTLASLGADGTTGGGDYDVDLVRTLNAPHRDSPPPEPAAPCSGKTELTIARGEVDEALQNVAEVSKGVRVTPAMSNGVVSGLKLSKLHDGFLLRVGLCEGDVVNTLNGVSVASPDKALEAYSRLRGAKRVDIAITREGKPLMITVTVR